jgi:active breakpoint cluster region-related protein
MFFSDSYEAEQLLKEVDIHSVTGILKSYLRELPEALFTDNMYPKFVEAFNHRSHTTEAQRGESLMVIFAELPMQNRSTINLILEHLMRYVLYVYFDYYYWWSLFTIIQ